MALFEERHVLDPALSRDAVNTDRIERLALAVLAALLAFYWTTMIAVQANVADVSHYPTVAPWVTGDWLINYSGGFVRRGLIGEIATRLYVWGGINLIVTVVRLKAAFYTVFIGSLLALTWISGIGLVEIGLLLSPAGVWFEMNDPVGSGRKEIALLAVFAAYVVLDTLRPAGDKPFYGRWQFWYQLVSLPLLVLVHEGLFIFFPLLLAFGYVTRRDDDDHGWLAYGIPYVAAAGAFALSYLFRGNAASSSAICSSLTAMSVDPRVCSGSVAAVAEYSVVIRPADIARYGVLAVLAFLPLLWYGHAVVDRRRWRAFGMAAAIAIACTLPLYAVSEDWGRWIHITWMLLFVTVLAAKRPGARIAIGGMRSILLIGVAMAIYVSAWRLPHWIHGVSAWR